MENKQIANNYEVRSSDMQELMRKPPHRFIFWGTAWVLIFLAFVFYVLNQFRVQDKIILQSKVLYVKSLSPANDSSAVVIICGAIPVKVNLDNRNSDLHFAYDTSGMRKVISGRIDSVGHSQYGELIVFLKVTGNLMNIKDGMIGDLEVEIANETYLAKLIDNTFKK